MGCETILLLEDDHRERIRMTEILEGCGYPIETAHGCTEAIHKVKAEDYPLVISSFDIQGGKSLELLYRIKEVNAGIEVVFLSKRVAVEDAVETIKAGAFDFLVKPVDPKQLHHLVLQILDVKKKDHSTRVAHPKRRIVTNNSKMLQLMEMGRQVADSRASVLINGESGTGKELFARFIHEHSNRRHKPFVAINCGALPETLLESELFGHEKGAFTGALAKKPGKFELTNGGTLLLDEITEMQYHLQSKLLRVLQEREVDRVGGRHPIPVDVRVIATTNRNIDEAVSKGDFREDLFYRLNVIPLHLPPLRKRSEDIPLLVEYFIDKYNLVDGRCVKSLTQDALEILMRHSFKGNVRELENIIERAVLLSGGNQIHAKDLMLMSGSDGVRGDTASIDDSAKHFMNGSLKDLEKKMIFHTLDKMNGNRTHAAKALGISVRTLRNKLNEYKNGLAN
jgi:two-component system response regulator FlrC